MSRADINRAYEAWKKSEMKCLEDAYKAPSEAKQWAWVRCMDYKGQGSTDACNGG